MKKHFIGMGLALLCAGQALAADTALVIAVQGKATLGGNTALESFVRLNEGDRVSLPADGQVALVFVGKARQETWKGKGIVQIGDGEAKAVAGKPDLQVKQIPPEVARQMNRTPVVNQDGRVGMLRLRGGVPPLDAVARVEQQYKELRGQAPETDLSPEIYLLAGLFDLRQYERVEAELARIEKSYAQNPAWPALRQVYAQALESVKKAQ